ncbi:MAG: hypothetical protein F7C82_06990 [Desulfurococcales archaeon]|nr:hypothetical protein [Desulfurococcales archaeon]MCE4622199.1 hypothetical protein [Desulfurococcales archaeon]MCE4626442.1 hypothetical protein [Desulfurococcales archaeon]MCE4630009.1 hypothetical protein [Desulfurococcales archaeon]
MPKATIKKVGKLAIVETEYGQKAVVPIDSLCELIINFNITIVNEDIKCERVGRRGKR